MVQYYGNGFRDASDTRILKFFLDSNKTHTHTFVVSSCFSIPFHFVVASSSYLHKTLSVFNVNQLWAYLRLRLIACASLFTFIFWVTIAFNILATHITMANKMLYSTQKQNNPRTKLRTNFVYARCMRYSTFYNNNTMTKPEPLKIDFNS